MSVKMSIVEFGMVMVAAWFGGAIGAAMAIAYTVARCA